MIKLSIVFITDKNYLLPTWCCIRSVLESKNNETFISFYIIGDRLSAEDKECISSSSNNIQGVEFVFIDVDSIGDFSDKDYGDAVTSWAPAVLYKFMLADLLPKNIDKVIYLDGDMLIRKDLTGLFETDLESNYLAAVRDTFYDNIAHEKRLNLPGAYINTGCMLLNLSLMRENNLCKKLIDTKIAHSELGIADQDTYNVVCKDRIKILPCRYNFYITNFLMNESIEGFSKYTLCPYTSREEMLEDIAVIHMIHFRPWKLSIKKREIGKILNEPLPDINEASIGYILRRWLKLYSLSPFYNKAYENIIVRESDVTPSSRGLLSKNKRGIVTFDVLQENTRNGIAVSLSFKGKKLITKVTNPTNNSKSYKLL